jgi:RimJ/RimL family protein N-acetyltransferase
VIVLETERLLLRTASLDDAEFMLRLLNEPSFLRFVGDRGVRTADDARGYIADRLIAGYEKNGYGLWVAELKASGTPIGISGLVRRDTLPDADIGFAFLPEYWRQGYAYESTAAAMRYAMDDLALPRLLAITDQENVASIRLLERLGLSFERMIQLADDAAELRLFAISNG